MKTQTSTENYSLANQISLIENLNLDAIKIKLMNKEDGEAWTLEQATLVEKWYKRFLFLCVKHPDIPIVPEKKIDTFWHYHILDTMKYAQDCEYIFGYFLHHFPYFGIRGEEDARNLEVAFMKTTELMHFEFEEGPEELTRLFMGDNKSAICGGGKCGSGCKKAMNSDDFDYARPTLSSIAV